MKNINQFSDRDLRLLSAYVDGELSPKEKKHVNHLLAVYAETKTVVEKIKQVKLLLRQLPVRSVPRNFTITAQAHQKFQIPSLAGVFRYSTMVSALLLAIVLVFDRFSLFQFKSSQLSADRWVENSVSKEDADTQLDVPAPVITLNPTNPPAAQELGMGGGGGEELRSDAVQPELPAPDAESSAEEKLSDELPFTDQEIPIIESDLLPQEAKAQPRKESDSTALEQAPQAKGDGLILGVRPAEEQGEIQSGDEASSVRSADADEQTVSLWMVEAVLAGLMVISAIFFYFLRRISK